MKKMLVFLLISYLFEGCYSPKAIIKNGENITESAICNAISDFTDNCNLFKRDSIFYVSIRDTALYLVLQSNMNDTRWVCEQTYPDILTIEISSDINKIPYLSDAIIGSKGKLPSRYLIIKGKLFYWDDDNYPLTEETLAIYKKYNALTDIIDVNNKVLPDLIIDDAQEAAHYYFCKKNTSKYKRVITSVALGYYKPPRVKCD